MESPMEEYAAADEVVSVAELFEEELAVLVEQHDILTRKNTRDSIIAAESLLHVINYFRIRLGIETGTEIEDLYGAGPDETIH